MKINIANTCAKLLTGNIPERETDAIREFMNLKTANKRLHDRSQDLEAIHDCIRSNIQKWTFWKILKISKPFQNILWGKYESVNNAYAGACAMPDRKQQRQKQNPIRSLTTMQQTPLMTEQSNSCIYILSLIRLNQKCIQLDDYFFPLTMSFNNV